jgi:hypothetical protein
MSWIGFSLIVRLKNIWFNREYFIALAAEIQDYRGGNTTDT